MRSLLCWSLPFVTLAAVPAQAWQVAATTGFANHAMAYDSARDRIVRLAHGVTGALLFEWDGITWRQRHANGPTTTASSVPHLAYDSHHRRTVALIDGHTWLWNGADWQLADSQSPGANDTGTNLMAWDAARQVVVFRSPLFQTTYEWNGTGWRAIAGPIGPFPYTWPCLGYDPVTQRVLATIPAFQTAFTWDGATWSQVIPATVPYAMPQRNMAVATDPISNRLYLFGGDARAGSTPEWTDSVWRWDGANWSQVLAGLARRRAAMAPFPSSGRLLVCGGDAGDVFFDTWELDPASNFYRREQEPCLLSAIADPLRGRVVATSCSAYYPASYTTLAWDGVAWQQLQPASPAARVLAYDSARDQIVGVENDFYSPQMRTWLLTPAGWQLQAQATNPGWQPRWSMAFDPMRQVTVLYGALGGTWEWDGTTWTQRVTAHGPLVSWNTRALALAFDPNVQLIRMLVQANSGFQGWLYDGTDWTPAGDANVPTIGGGALRHDPVGNRMIYTAGESAQQGTWELTGGAWVPIHMMTVFPNALFVEPTRGVLMSYQQGIWYALRPDLAAATRHGAGCGLGSVPWLAIAGRPSPAGGEVRFEFGDAPAHAPAALYAALTPANAGLGGGCTLLLGQPEHFGDLVLDAHGGGSLLVALPAVPALIGLDVYWQGAALQTGGPLFGVAALTNGVRTHLGI
ncbi:MAG: hypothetical protein IPK26_15630 [Planctomycetes bacterium]|nr:hypothetical protein [Planctomycetota bacterium]